MANNPVTRNVLKYKGAGSPQVFPNLPTMLNGSQDGSNVGTGGNPASLELSVPSGTFVANRTIEFLDDRYCLCADNSNTSSGVYKKAEGGAGLWGRVQGQNSPFVDGGMSGLYVLHPNGTPTLALLYFDNLHELRVLLTEDGLTGGAWGSSAGTVLETQGVSPGSHGQAIVFRSSIIWAHASFGGAAGTGAISQYDLVTTTLTRYNVSTVLNANADGSSYAFHVHDNVVFLSGWNISNFGVLAKLAGGSFGLIYTDGTQGEADTNMYGHSALFTDTSSGDLVLIMSGRTSSVAGTKVVSFADATGAATPTERTTDVLGATEGADKYIASGGAGHRYRRWSVFVDTETAPATPRTYLTTWVPAGSTETWEWKGIGAEMEAVSGLGGVSDDFALPYETYGGGHRSPRTAAVEIGDASSAPLEVVGGTKFFFRGRGSTAVGVVTFRGTDTENAPSTIVPVVAASLTIEAGAPPSTPTISGNTLINFTPDNGATLYSVVLETNAAGVDIAEGDVGIIIPTFV